jgi:hypothetical protein
MGGMHRRAGRNRHLPINRHGQDRDQRDNRDRNRRRRADHDHPRRYTPENRDHIYHVNRVKDAAINGLDYDAPIIPMAYPPAKRAHILPLLAVIVLLASPLPALNSSSLLLDHAWPNVPSRRVTDIGRGIGVVFSPDLSVADNCRFYQSLGFACFQDADWAKVLDSVHRYNVLYPERRIFTLILETHGTNGNGLKLQTSYDPGADRSYIAAGALQQHLEPQGIYYVIISACNSGRLLRPAIYNQLDPNNGDKLFLPATKGIVDATPDFIASRSAVTIITPESSHIETTLVGKVLELSPAARRAIAESSTALGIVPPKEFAVSDMMVAMLTRDPKLQLTSGSYVEELSRDTAPVDRSELLFNKFVRYVNGVAARQFPVPAHTNAARKSAKKKSATVR